MYNLILLFHLVTLDRPVEFTIQNLDSLEQCQEYYKGYEDTSLNNYVKGYFHMPLEFKLDYISRSCEKSSI